MFYQLLLIFAFLGAMHVFVSWMSYQEASQIRGERQARHRHPTGKRPNN